MKKKYNFAIILKKYTKLRYKISLTIIVWVNSSTP